MSIITVWLLVISAGTGSHVAPQMFNTQADCLKVAKHLEFVLPKCVYTTVVVKK